MYIPSCTCNNHQLKLIEAILRENVLLPLQRRKGIANKSILHIQHIRTILVKNLNPNHIRAKCALVLLSGGGS